MSERHGRVEVTSRAEWRAWLAAHHSDVRGIWVVTYKKRRGELHVPYDALVEEALCFGWIDSQGRGLDEDRTQLLMTPRRRGSGWSRSNQQRIERLDAAGLLAAPGRAVVEAARADGSWHALDAVEDLVEPEALRDALDGTPGARGHWDAFPRSAKRAILQWIGSARRAETREKRVRETADLAAQGLRANEWPRRQAPGGGG